MSTSLDYIVSPWTNTRDYDIATEVLARLPKATPNRFERAAQVMSRIAGEEITPLVAEAFEDKIMIADPDALAFRSLSSRLSNILATMEGKASAHYVLPPSTDSVKRYDSGALLCLICNSTLHAQSVGELATVHMQV